MLSAMGPKYAKFIMWKKYLTAIQLVGIQRKVFAWWIGGHGVLFLVLFSNFFMKSYINKEDNLKI